MRLFIRQTTLAARRTFVRLMTRKIKAETVKPLGLSVPLFLISSKKGCKKTRFFYIPYKLCFIFKGYQQQNSVEQV